MATVLGLTWVGAPLVRHFSSSHRLRSHETTVLVDLVQIGLVLALGFWTRESMSKTAVNRRLYATVILTFVAQALLAIAMARTGVAPEVTHWLHLFLWSVVLGGVAIHTERALWPSAVATGAMFLATARDRSWMHLGMAGVDAFLMINMVVVWWPKLEPHRRSLTGRRGP